jgi:hypothetical protein
MSHNSEHPTPTLVIPGLLGCTDFSEAGVVQDISKHPAWFATKFHLLDPTAELQEQFKHLDTDLIASLLTHVPHFVLSRALWLYRRAKEQGATEIVAHSGGTIYALVLAVLCSGDEHAPQFTLYAPIGLSHRKFLGLTRAFFGETGKWSSSDGPEKHSLVEAAQIKIKRFLPLLSALEKEIETVRNWNAWPLLEILANCKTTPALHLNFLMQDALAPLPKQVKKRLKHMKIEYNKIPDSAHAINWHHVVVAAMNGARVKKMHPDAPENAYEIMQHQPAEHAAA